MTATAGFAALRQLARQPVQAPPPAPERCELCGAAVEPGHRHLLDLAARQFRCACRACALLFDRRAAGGGHYRLVPDRRRYLQGFVLDDRDWDRLRIPVHLAFFFHDSAVGRVVAFYPSPGGAVESLLEIDAWAAMAARNPVLHQMEGDVEALLVNHARGSRSHWLVPIDDCYRLVGLIRTGWKGLAGGQQVWDEISRFFDRLGGTARTTDQDGSASPRRALSDGS